MDNVLSTFPLHDDLRGRECLCVCVCTCFLIALQNCHFTYEPSIDTGISTQYAMSKDLISSKVAAAVQGLMR